MPEEIVEKLIVLKKSKRTLIEKIRYGDSNSCEITYWIIHTEPRDKADERMEKVVEAWGIINR